ncbi:hypothetical protein [Dysgonomonas reticulitermitis]
MKIDKNNIVENLGNIDLFICASGFESRSTSFALLLDAGRVNHVIAFHQRENYSISEQNLKSINGNFPKMEIIEFPKNKSFDTFEIFIDNLDKYIQQTYIKDKLEVIVDITAFTRETLLILLRVLTIPYIIEHTNIKLVYMPAQSYQKDWMTKGVREIRPVLGYSGLLSPSKPSLLVMLTGFEEERMRTVIDIYEPSHILLGKPCKESSINQELFAISEMKYEELKSEYEHLIIDDGFTFSCQDIGKTKSIILDIYNKYNNYNIIVVPLNNKISTLGVAFAALKEEGIQICYPSANQYNIENFSTPSDFFCLYDIKQFL